MNSTGWDPGDLHFQIKRTGLAWANVNGKASSRPAFEGDPIARDRWQHIVGVISRKTETVKTFINGTLAWEQQFKLRNPINPGNCRLGTWGGIPEEHQPTQRSFKGRMDEVAIWSRALTPEEIQAHLKPDVRVCWMTEATSVARRRSKKSIKLPSSVDLFIEDDIGTLKMCTPNCCRRPCSLPEFSYANTTDPTSFLHRAEPDHAHYGLVTCSSAGFRSSPQHPHHHDRPLVFRCDELRHRERVSPHPGDRQPRRERHAVFAGLLCESHLHTVPHFDLHGRFPHETGCSSTPLQASMSRSFPSWAKSSKMLVTTPATPGSGTSG